ncbi:MAG: hypothetical protein ACP5U2_07240 [Bryobacteraceae bacterium]
MRLAARWIFCLAAIAQALQIAHAGDKRTPPDLRVAVFPFANRSASSLDWISESLAERLSDLLAASGLQVADRDVRLEACQRLSLPPSARLSRASLIKIAEELDATVAVYGEFGLTAPGDAAPPEPRATIRLEAACLKLAPMQLESCGVEQGPLSQLSELQHRLAWQILERLAPGTAPRLEDFLRENSPVRLDALENYVRGLLADTPEQKHRFLTQAARLAPGFSSPSFELGRLNFERKQYRLAAGWLERVRPGSRQYWRAQFLLGLCRYYAGEFAAAEAVFEGLAARLPLNEVLNNLGVVQARRNRPEALQSFMKALQGDPGDSDYNFNVALMLWKRSDFEAAAEYFRRVLELDAEDKEAAALLERCLQKRGPRAADPRDLGRERVKLQFGERAWIELNRRLSAGSQ